MAIAALVSFLAVWVLGIVLLVTGIFRGPDGGSLIGLAFVVGGSIGAIAAAVELIRSAVNADRPTRPARLDR